MLRRQIDREWMQEFLLRALAYPSPQTDLLEDDPRMAAFIRDVVRPAAEALRPQRLATDAMGNLVAVWGTGVPALALVVYAMTHPQTIMPDAFTPTVVDGAAFGIAGPCVRGRGACEQKGPLAAAIAALRVVVGQPVSGERAVALMAVVAGETGRPVAIERLLKEGGVAPEMAVVACGTDNAICLGQKGRVDVEIAVRGRQSHSSMPWLGLNALEGAAAVLARLAAHKILADDVDLGPITLTPTALVTEPHATHTIPEVARITVDRRLRPGETPHDAVEGLRALVGAVPPFELSWTTGAYMYPYRLPADSRLPRLLRQGWDHTVGRPAAMRYMSGGLDAGYLNARRIESVMFGPGSPDRAHTRDDLVSLEQCLDAAAVYAYALHAAMHGC